MTSILTIKEQARCKVDIMFYTQTIFKHFYHDEFIIAPHHEKLVLAQGLIFTGQVKKLLIAMPSRWGKTLMMVYIFITWGMGVFPDSNFLHVACTLTLAQKNTRECRNIMLSDIYKEIFPYVRISLDSKAVGDYHTTLNGSVYASGIGGTILGYGGGKMRKGTFGGAVIADDLHKPEEVLTSEDLRLKVYNFMKNTVFSRKNNEDMPFIVLMQRLHLNDIIGELLNENSGWEYLKLPALDENGKSNWEYKESTESLQRVRKSRPEIFETQYMQNPIASTGGLFKREWFKYYTLETTPAFDYKIITVDTAQKTKTKNDYTVMQCWGFYKNCAYLHDQLRGKWQTPYIKGKFFEFYDKHSKYADEKLGEIRKVYIEDAMYGTTLIQELTILKTFNVGKIHRVKDKRTRASDVAPFVESGRTYIRKDSEWIEDFLSEVCIFTTEKDSRHDDQVDCMVDALFLLLRKKRKFTGTWGG